MMMISISQAFHTYYKRFRVSLTKKAVVDRSDETCLGIKFKNYHHFRDVEQIKSFYIDFLLELLTPCLVYEHLVTLDTCTWAKDSQTNTESYIQSLCSFETIAGEKQKGNTKRFPQINCFEKLYSSHYPQQ